MTDFIQEMLEADPVAKAAYDREERLHRRQASIVKELVAQRKALKLTQAEVAKEMAISQAHLAGLESGREQFNFRRLLEYAEIVGIHFTLSKPSPRNIRLSKGALIKRPEGGQTKAVAERRNVKHGR